jgi:chromosome partitioning protein
VSDLARTAILAADFVLIPVQPSPFDVWASEDIVHLIREAQQFREGIKAAFVVNRKIANTAIGRDVVAAFESYPFEVLTETVGQRVIFAEAAAAGLTILESAPSSDAAREIGQLATAIAGRMEFRG